MKQDTSNDHPSAERLQALLEGGLPEREAARLEEHVAACARCASEMAAWRVLIEDLDALPSYRPTAGFAQRVMADLRLPDRSAAARAAVDGRSRHVAAETLQDYVDGALGRRRRARVESHLAACGACASEAEGWKSLIGGLERLDRFEPTPGFGARILAGVDLPHALPWAARVGAAIDSLLSGSVRHAAAETLQEYAEGLLPARRAARVARHIDACPSCATEAEAWSTLAARLGTLERFEPQPGFAGRVMAAVRVAAPVRVGATAVPGWRRTLAVARRLVPQTRQAWAAISGVAVTPAVTVGLVLYAVFSHPTLTPGALASFAWWQLTDLAAAGWNVLSAALLQSGELFGVYSVFEALAAAPVVVAGGVLLYSLVSALALRVLYKNVIANRPLDGRYVRVSAS